MKDILLGSSNSINTPAIQFPTSCLTAASFDTFSLATEHLDVFINYLSSHTSDMPIEYYQVISIVSDCSNLMNCVHTYQYLFIEHAIDDYFSLDEHFDLIYERVLEILDHLYHLSTINSDIYSLGKELLYYLPSNYSNRISSSFSTQIVSSLIQRTAQLFSSSSSNSQTDNNENDENECVLSPSKLFSSSSISINIDIHQANKLHDDSCHRSESLLQLDKINVGTMTLAHSQLTSMPQFDFNDFEQIENDLGKEFT